MKITLGHEDVMKYVTNGVQQSGMCIPEDPEIEVSHSEEEGITITINGVTVAPIVTQQTQEPATAPARKGAVPARNPATRFDPDPSPPREKLEAPDRTLGDEEDEPLPVKVHNERSIRSMVGASQELLARTPDPTKVQHTAARQKFPKTLAADTIEGLGKDPTDFKDEL